MNPQNVGIGRSVQLCTTCAARVALLVLLAGAIALALVGSPIPASAQTCDNGGTGLHICTDRLPDGTMGALYSEQIPYVCPNVGCYFGIGPESPDLPTGMTFSAGGVLSGSNGPLPTPGSFYIEVTFSNYWTLLETRNVWITVNGTNTPPSFTPGSDISLRQDDPPYSAVWATAISTGGPDEIGQSVGFLVSNDNRALFSVQPTISTDGTLSFELAPDAAGVANLSVYLQDDGGTYNGGINRSPTVTFQITVTPYDQPQNGPTFIVNTTDWSTNHACTKHHCSLREAIEAANNYGGDPSFGLPSIIELAPGAVYTIDGVDNLSTDDSPNGLPQITSYITINGHGARIVRSDTAPATRLIDVGGGFLILNEVALENGAAGPGKYGTSIGGALIDRGKLAVKNCFFTNNAADYGSAIYSPGGPTLWVYNSTFYANVADETGAIHAQGAVNLYNNTFVNNQGANTSSGATSTIWLGSDTSRYDIFNNLIVAENQDVPLCNLTESGITLPMRSNLATDDSCSGFGMTTYAALKLAPLPAANGGPTANVAIETGSSAIDVGDVTVCRNPAMDLRDQRGKSRFIDGDGDAVAQCDVGAYEFGAPQASPPMVPELDAPQVSILLSPAAPDGDEGWYRSPVMVEPQASDASPVIELRCALDPAGPPASFDDLPDEPCTFLAGALMDTNGEHIFYAAAVDIWGNKSAITSADLRIDITERFRSLLPFAQTLPSAPPAAPPDPQ